MKNSSLSIDKIINFSLIILGSITLVLMFRGCIISDEKHLATIGNKIDIRSIDFSKKDKTILLVINPEETEIADNIPFYKVLKNFADTANSFQMKSLFTSGKKESETFLTKNTLNIEYEINTKIADLGLETSPVLLVVDNQGFIKIIQEGIITSEKEIAIKKELSLPVEEKIKIEPLQITKTKEIYNENSVLKEISLPEFLKENHSGAKFKSPSYKEINAFGIDKEQNAYIIYQEHLVKVDKNNQIVKMARLNSDFGGGFEVDQNGNSYFFLKSKKFLIWNKNLDYYKTINLEQLISTDDVCVKILLSSDEKYVFFQTYNTVSKTQTLYKLDLYDEKLDLIYKVEKTPYTIPSFGLGVFAWTVSSKNLFVADIFKYEIQVFSLQDNSKIDSITDKYRKLSINPADSMLINLGIDMPFILKPESMTEYPAVWSLSVGNNDALFVFTSERNSEHRQIINIYDNRLNKVGTDLKYFNPINNNHKFFKDLVFVADCTPTQTLNKDNWSPMESLLAVKIKVFKLL